MILQGYAAVQVRLSAIYRGILVARVSLVFQTRVMLTLNSHWLESLSDNILSGVLFKTRTPARCAFFNENLLFLD